MKKKVHLVLGSGGARGMAHIAVIDRLLEDGFEIVDVVGCSMGAVVGGMYCAGHLGAYRDWLLARTKSDIYRLFDLAFSMAGLVKGDRIFGALKQMTGDQKIETLAIPFTAVATDLFTHNEVHFSSGDLYKALRASTGIPGVFTPMAWHQHLFVDGGVLNPLPINLVRKRNDAIIVAVNLNGAVLPKTPTEVIAAVTESPAPLTKAELLPKVHHFYSREEEESLAAEVAAVVEPAHPEFSMFELLNASYDATLDRLVQLSLQLYPPDVLIEIPRDVCSVFDFFRAAEVIEKGRQAYGTALAAAFR